MNIAIDISPLTSGHSVRGVGFYLQHLKEALQAYDGVNTYTFFTDYTSLTAETDVVHFPYFDPFFLTLPGRKKYKTVVTVHDLTPLVFPKQFPAGLKGNLKWQLQKRRLKGIDLIVTDSYSSKNDICCLTGVGQEKVSVVYLAAGEEYSPVTDRNALNRVDERYHLPEKFALYVGDVTWNKNIPSLIKAITEVNIPLVLVGKALASTDYDRTNPWNNDLATAQLLIKDNPLCTVLGFVSTDDLVALYNLATVLVMPSHYEGFGLPILEAMQSGTPVVATHGGSLKEIAADAVYVVPADSISDLAAGIKKVFDDDGLQRILREKGFMHVKQFTWKKTAEQMIEVYQSLQ